MRELTPHQSRALNIKNSISLTANAGSGKTLVLSQRYLEIILNTDTPLNQVAAITFTEKAAGELFKRVSTELSRLLETSTDKNLKQSIEKIRKQLVSAKISTIHSFCIDLLKEYPVEASIDASFTPINEQKAQELINLSIENGIKEIFKDAKEQDKIKLLIRLFGSKTGLINQLSEMISKRKIVLNLIEKIYSSGETEIERYFAQSFQTGLKLIFSDEIPLILNQVKIVNKKVLENKSDNETGLDVKKMLSDLSSENDELKVLRTIKVLGDKILTKDGKVRSQSYLNSKIRGEILDSVMNIESFYNDLQEINFVENYKDIEKELVKFSLALVQVFQNVLSIYEIKKSELGYLDFEDILIKTKNLLHVESVKKSLSGKYKFLLIDEYQDTNEIQYEIFLPLLEDLKKGNLFIVGDEKQSIYRFRDADLQVFSRTKTDIEKLYGKESQLTLPDSFRMAPAICFFVNQIFKNIFEQPINIYNEVAFSELVCARSDKFKGHVEFLIAENEDQNESELVARKIIQLKSENPDRIADWNDIAVLVRKRASFSELQKEFIKYQIPFIIVGGTGFYQQQSISDIYNYFAFLLNDKDDGALIGTLRSPFFNISDGEIFELSCFEGETYWDKLKTASDSKKELWKKTFTVINENKNLSKRINISFLLRKVLQESSFIPAMVSRVNGDQELSNLDKLISLTNQFFNEEFNTMYDYVSFLKDAISGTQDEAQAEIEAGKNGVNILTIHQAKGLEYPAIFLYNCNDYTSVNKVKAKSFTIDKEYGLLTKIPLNENYFGNYHSAPLIGLYNLIESKKDLAELKRLLYVGLTRAEDYLFVTFSNDGKHFKKNSFAGLINDGLNADFSKKTIELKGELTFLRKENCNYSNASEEIHLGIPITKHINAVELITKKVKQKISPRNFILSEIKDQSTGEVISATRYSTFADCPSKYNLLYNYKVGDLYYRNKNKNSYLEFDLTEDYNRNELYSQLLDDKFNQNEFSKFKGNLIHYILSKNIDRSEIAEFVRDHIKKTFKVESTELLESEMINELLTFYNSEEFKLINSFPVFKNEFEVYLKEEDYYLFGIIDKLIITDKKLIIVDYKTDSVKKDKIIDKAEKYLSQLEFYSYITSRLFNKKREIEGRIIFIKHPDNPFILNYDKISGNKVKSGLKEMINSIRSNNYSLNQNACKECVFIDGSERCKSLSS